MPIDSSIPLQAGKGVTPLADPFQLAQGAGQLAGMQQQLATGRMQQQQMQMQMQDEQTMRQLAASGKYQTPDQMADAAMGAGVSPKTVLALKMQGADYQAKVASTAQSFATAAQRGGAAQEAKIKAVGQQAAEARNLALTAPDEATYQAGLQQLDQKYASLGVPSLFQKYGAFTPQNRTMLAVNGQTVQDANDAAFGKVVSGADGPLLMKQPQVPGAAPQVSALAGSKPMPVMLPGGGTGFANPDPVTGQMPAGMKPIPNMGMIMAGASSGLSLEAKQMLVDKYKTTGVLDSDLSARMPGLRTEIINAAAAQSQGQTPDLAGAKVAFKTKQDAQKYFTTGAGANAFRQQETILHHADVFSQISDALNNGNVQLANQLGNQFGAQFGSDQATNFKIAGQIFSAEVGKYLAGSQSTAEERRELSNLIPSFSSPQQIQGGLQTLKQLVEGQRQSWTVQRDAALKGNVPTYPSEQGTQSTPKVITLSDAKATAQSSGKTVEQVISAARAKGWSVQ